MKQTEFTKLVDSLISTDWTAQQHIRQQVQETVSPDQYSDAKVKIALSELVAQGAIEESIRTNPQLARKDKSERIYRRVGSWTTSPATFSGVAQV